MAHRLLKLYNLGLYILSVLSFFMLGLYYAKWTGAGDNQGLAAAAIVLGYGVMAAGIALLISFFVAFRFERNTIIRINWFLLLILLIFVCLTAYEVQKRKKDREPAQETPVKPMKTSKPADKFLMGSFSKNDNLNYEFSGMGMFKCELQRGTLMLYGLSDIFIESPVDSIVFGPDKFGNTSILSAPPDLFPEQMKLDYQILFFKIISLGRQSIQIEINKVNNLSRWVSREQGEILLWPEFLLQVHSIEILPEYKNPIKIKALESASDLQLASGQEYILQPICVKGDWLQIKILDQNYNEIDDGWVKWFDDGNVVINYVLLS